MILPNKRGIDFETKLLKGHVKAKILKPWLTKLCFKLSFLNVCGLHMRNLN